MARTPRIGVYFGDYSHISGLWVHWVHALRVLDYDWLPLWDHSFVQKDTLAALDVLIVPGGFCWNRSDAFGGEAGRRSIRQMVKKGGTYIGTCYGADVAMTKGNRRGVFRLGLIQGCVLDGNRHAFMGTTKIDYRFSGSSYVADNQSTAHINGPRFGGGDYEVMGRFSTVQPGPFEQRPGDDIAGQTAAVTAKLGRGRVFLFAGHPEIPIRDVYDKCVSDILDGKIGLQGVIRRLWNPPAISTDNVRLLETLLRSCPAGGNGKDQYVIDGAWLSERIALLASSKELLKLRFQEVRQQVETIAGYARTGVLKCACKVAERRLRQVQHIIAGIDPKVWAESPGSFARNSLVVLLQRIYCGCDHPGIMREARLDSMTSAARALAKVGNKTRTRNEERLARRVLGIVVRSADEFMYACGGVL